MDRPCVGPEQLGLASERNLGPEHVDAARTHVGFRQYANSVSRIVKNPHVRSGRGIGRHSMWQVRKLFDRFPFEQSISRSRMIATDRGCATSALVYSQGICDYDNMSGSSAFSRLAEPSWTLARTPGPTR